MFYYMRFDSNLIDSILQYNMQRYYILLYSIPFDSNILYSNIIYATLTARLPRESWMHLAGLRHPHHPQDCKTARLPRDCWRHIAGGWSCRAWHNPQDASNSPWAILQSCNLAGDGAAATSQNTVPNCSKSTHAHRNRVSSYPGHIEYNRI